MSTTPTPIDLESAPPPSTPLDQAIIQWIADNSLPRKTIGYVNWASATQPGALLMVGNLRNVGQLPEVCGLLGMNIIQDPASNRQVLMVQARDTGDNGVPFFDLIFDGILESDVANLVADLAACEKTANKGVANGYASLDSGGRVPFSQLPAGLAGALEYQGVWNATTNSPALASGVGTAGFFYKVSVAGGTVLDGNADWHVGDLLIFDGTSWDKIDNYEAVTSVAGRTGAVVLTKADVGLSNVTNDAQLKASDLDTDGTLAANSDAKIPSQKAVKTYVDAHSGGTGGNRGFWLNNISVGSDVCPHLRAGAAGTLSKVTVILRRTITLTFSMTLMLDGNVACTINVPSTTAVDSIVAVTVFSYSTVVADSIFKLAITASDSSVDPQGVATVQIFWS
jgi:hypothetical protein